MALLVPTRARCKVFEPGGVRQRLTLGTHQHTRRKGRATARAVLRRGYDSQTDSISRGFCCRRGMGPGYLEGSGRRELPREAEADEQNDQADEPVHGILEGEKR